MKNILFLAVMMVLVSCSSSKKADKKDSQEQQKPAVENILFTKAVTALENKDFVLEANWVELPRGQSVYVSANTNFISVKGDKGMVQMAFTGPAAGPNGIGGITVEGTVSNIKMNTDKKGNIHYSMNIQGAAVSSMINFTIPKGSNGCTATITPNLGGNRISFTGFLYPSSESNVSKGRSF